MLTLVLKYGFDLDQWLPTWETLVFEKFKICDENSHIFVVKIEIFDFFSSKISNSGSDLHLVVLWYYKEFLHKNSDFHWGTQHL